MTANQIVLPALGSLPSPATARLPELYRGAVTALERAASIDECKAWSDRMQALTSYARQAGDDRLYKMAMRIQARASRRCGELLAQIEPANGLNQNIKDADGPKVATRTIAAREAGMSERQRKTALRVAAVPRETFEEQVESNNPPTVTALAEQGTKKRGQVVAEGIPHEDYRAATELQGALRRLAEYCSTHDAARIAAAFQTHERPELREFIAASGEWLRSFAHHLPE
ncbi:hypothetical protein [Paraburkholderia adhaesiva]|uniref:hypothetical protein n=1 Tax=Paraburkholderia adhaesiva TaxID=2883244 RepID=UPI001F491F07|nr:hypothetical protein [Paraburkholderia adhaesiva]